MKPLVLAVAAALAVSALGSSGNRVVTESGSRAVAVTLDDLPATAVAGGTCNGGELADLTGRLLAHIQTHLIPATGFVTESRICDRLRDVWLPNLLSMWLDAGVGLGNHTFSHLDINADHLGAVVEMLTKRGYRFVSLDEALKDDAYRSPDGYVESWGLSWIHRWGMAKGLEVEEEPREPDWLGELFRSY